MVIRFGSRHTHLVLASLLAVVAGIQLIRSHVLERKSGLDAAGRRSVFLKTKAHEVERNLKRFEMQKAAIVTCGSSSDDRQVRILVDVLANILSSSGVNWKTTSRTDSNCQSLGRVNASIYIAKAASDKTFGAAQALREALKGLRVPTVLAVAVANPRIPTDPQTVAASSPDTVLILIAGHSPTTLDQDPAQPSHLR